MNKAVKKIKEVKNHYGNGTLHRNGSPFKQHVYWDQR